jgi:hypothetical protein
LNCQDKREKVSLDNRAQERGGDLACGCSSDMAALHFWLIKFTRKDPEVPGFDDERWCAVEYCVYDPVLTMVKSAITTLTGLQLQDLFKNEVHHTTKTAISSLDHLATLISSAGDSASGQKIHDIKESLMTFLEEQQPK